MYNGMYPVHGMPLPQYQVAASQPSTYKIAQHRPGPMSAPQPRVAANGPAAGVATNGPGQQRPPAPVLQRRAQRPAQKPKQENGGTHASTAKQYGNGRPAPDFVLIRASELVSPCPVPA